MNSKIIKTKPVEMMIRVTTNDDDDPQVVLSAWQDDTYHYEAIATDSLETARELVGDFSEKSAQRWLNRMLKTPEKCEKCGHEITNSVK